MKTDSIEPAQGLMANYPFLSRILRMDPCRKCYLSPVSSSLRLTQIELKIKPVLDVDLGFQPAHAASMKAELVDGAKLAA
jgi:hypothetical protein